MTAIELLDQLEVWTDRQMTAAQARFESARQPGQIAAARSMQSMCGDLYAWVRDQRAEHSVEQTGAVS